MLLPPFDSKTVGELDGPCSPPPGPPEPGGVEFGAIIGPPTLALEEVTLVEQCCPVDTPFIIMEVE